MTIETTGASTPPTGAPTPAVNQTTAEPGLDDIISSMFGSEKGQTPETPTAPEPVKETIETKTNLDKVLDDQRKYFKERRSLQLEKERIRKERAELEALRKLPSEKKPDETKPDANEFDSIVDEILNNPRNKNLSEENVAKLIEQKLKEFQEGQQKTEAQTRQQREAQATIEEFKAEAKDYVKVNAEKFPLLEGFGQTDLILSVIEQDYRKNVEEYGEEYAAEHEMKPAEAAKHAENHLASQLKTALKSQHSRNFLKKLIAEIEPPQTSRNSTTDSNQSSPGHQSSSPSFLSNDAFTQSGAPKNEQFVTDEEAFNAALKLLP